jgi:hypothetical protein
MNTLNLLFSRGGMIGGADGPTSIFVSAGISIFFLVAMIGLIGLAERVLFAVAAYNDASSKSNPDAIMWALLIGFLGLIPGIIYLCVRNSGQGYAICCNCGCTYHMNDMNCPRCGAPNPMPAQYGNPFAAQQQHRAKALLIAALVLIGVGIVSVIVINIGLFFLI